MKLLRPNIRTPKMDDNVGRGMDIALTVALMFGVGFVLDRWLGTAPIFMIAMTVLAGVGFFAKFKYQYDARMDELAGRADRPGQRRVGVEPAMTDPATSMFTTRIEGPAPEVEVSTDLIKRGLIVAPLLIAICGVDLGRRRRLVGDVRHRPRPRQLRARRRADRGDDPDLAHDDARRRAVRLPRSASALIFVAVFAVKDAGWISLPALGATIIVTHLGSWCGSSST